MNSLSLKNIKLSFHKYKVNFQILTMPKGLKLSKRKIDKTEKN